MSIGREDGRTPPIPAGWYSDPATPGGMRWWNGTSWTHDVRASEIDTPPLQPLQFDPAAQPSLRPQPQSMPTTPANWQQLPAANNSPGWLALGLGLLSTVLLGVAVFSGWFFYGLLFSIFGALFFGIQALRMRWAGKATVFVPPILGIIAGSLTIVAAASVLLVNAFAGSALSLGNASDDGVQYPNNPEMAAMYHMGYLIEHRLRLAQPNGNWPSRLTANEYGEVVYNGTSLGVLEPGQIFSYQTVDSGKTFLFTISGRSPGEDVRYDSSTKELIGECYKTDVSCNRTPNP